MNRKTRKIIFTISIFVFIILIYGILASGFSFSNINISESFGNDNMITSEDSTSANISTGKGNKKDYLNDNSNNTANQKDESNNKEDDKTIHYGTITPTVPVETPTIKKTYYYSWTNERDYTGRSCLYLYDMDGNKVDGYVNILYYGNQKKKVYVINENDKCFLDDKSSIVIVSIEKDGIIYEQ